MCEEVRMYVRHTWIQEDDDATCYVCGISESEWEEAIENNPAIEWDCWAIQDRNAGEPLGMAG